MKRWFTLFSLLFALVWSGCDFDPITSAVDDFNIVVELEDINTGFSLGVFDSETKAILDQNVSIKFDSLSALRTIDIFSDPISEEIFDGGFISVGLRNEFDPSSESPITIGGTIRVDGYLDKDFSVTLTDTGATSFNIDLISLDNLSGSYGKTSIQAPLDEFGNPDQIPFPFDTLTGQPNPLFKSSSANFFELTFAPKLVLHPDISPDDIKWTLDNEQSFTGLPAEYSIVAYRWNPDTPEFNEGNYSYTRESCIEAFSFDLRELDRLCSEATSTLIPGERGLARRIFRIIDLQVRGVNTQLSTIKGFEYIGNKEIEKVFSGAEPIAILKAMIFNPTRDENWHTSVLSSTNESLYLTGKGWNEEEARNKELKYTYKMEPQSVAALAWASEFSTAVDDSSLVVSNNIYLPYTSTNFGLPSTTGLVNPYLFAEGDLVSNVYMGYELAFWDGRNGTFGGQTDHYPSMYYHTSTISTVVDSWSPYTFVVEGYSTLESKNISVRADGTTWSPSGILNPDESGEYPVGNTFAYNRLPDSPVNVTVNLGHTTFTQYVDLRDQSGTITLTPPTAPSNLITAEVTANISCKSSGSKELNISGFPINNIAIRYTEQGATQNYPQVGRILGTNYNENTQVLESVRMQFPGVEIGKTYDFIFSVDAFSETSTQTIDGEDFEIEVEVRDSYCQDK